MDNVRLAEIINISTRLIFGSVIALPLSVSNYEFSHQQGMSLKYSRTAPPLAVFDDERISLLNKDLADFQSLASKKKTETLNAGRGLKISSVRMASNVSRKFENLQKTMIAPTKKEIRFLAGMSLHKESSNVALIKNTIGKPVRNLQLNIAKNEIQREPARVAPEKIKSEVFVEHLAPNLRERVSEIENFDNLLNEDYEAESFENKAKSVLASAGVNPEAPSDYEIANTRGTGVGKRKTYSQRMQTVAARIQSGASLSQRFARSGYTKGLSSTTLPHPSDNNVEEKSTAKSIETTDEKGTVVASRNQLMQQSPIRQALISGPIEMTKGLALTNSQQLTVYRQVGGTRYGAGQVMLNEGRYEIFVDDPSSGIIVAELLDNGNLIGRAEVLLPEVMANAKSPEDLKNIPIQIAPVLDQVTTENISAYSFLKKEKVKGSQIAISDAVDANTKVFNSSIILKTTKDHYWGNIIVGSSKQLFSQILNPDATIQALKDILGITTPKEQMGIIKGDVVISGKHVAGAQIEIVSEAENVFKPVYFNSFIPDPSLDKTTENGEYAFIDIPQGSYLVRAKYKGKYLSPQVAPVEPGFVTQVKFDVQKPSLSEAFVFDIQTSEMVPAQIGFLGSGHKVSVQSKKLISFSGNEGIQFLEAEVPNQNYYLTRMTVDKSEKEILMPMISQQWLGDLLMRLKVNSIPDTGLIVGTALELPYSVELDPRAYNEDTKIIYFDNRGNLVPGAMATPSGGGFVAINVNQGIRSLFSKYSGTRNYKITTMVVDSSAINVYNSKF